MSLVNVTLDLLSHTCTLDSQTMLDTMCQSVLSALACRGQQVLDAVLARHLDKLGLATLRVGWILPLARHGVLVKAEGVRSCLLVTGLGGGFGDDGGGRIAGEEALQRSRQRLGQLDELRRGGHGGLLFREAPRPVNRKLSRVESSRGDEGRSLKERASQLFEAEAPTFPTRDQ